MIAFSAPINDQDWERYIDCRYRNLYEPFGLPRDVTTSELDSPRERPGVMHRIAWIDGELAAVGRLDLQLEHPAGPSAQLRYCAVDLPLRGRGAGPALIDHFEQEASARGAARLWMEARIAALGFYLRLGYADIGAGPTKYGVIPHRVLQKSIGHHRPPSAAG